MFMLSPLMMIAQDNNYYIYNIVTFEGDFDKEGIKVKIDDGKSVKNYVMQMAIE